MRPFIFSLWAVGFPLFAGLLSWQGFGDVAAAVAVAGWGLVWVTLFHLLPMTADAAGWYMLLPRPHRPAFHSIVRMRWITESVNGLLPVAQVGGDVIRARLLHQTGVRGAMAGASVVVDLTVGVMTQIAFALLGVALLIQRGGSVDAIIQLIVGISLFCALILAFYRVQRSGLFQRSARILERLAGDHDWIRIAGGAAALDRVINRLYRRQRQFWFACGWRLFSWLVGSGEVWLALYFLGHPVTLAEALILESLGQAVRACAFAIPGALGVQEGGYMLLGGMLGLGPETALALSLIKRVRELALGLPGLLEWNISEGRRLWLRQSQPCRIRR